MKRHLFIKSLFMSVIVSLSFAGALQAKSAVVSSDMTTDKPLIKKIFIDLAEINSQSIDTSDVNVFPVTEGQHRMAEKVQSLIRDMDFKKITKVSCSDYQYVYVKIPSNINKKVPSIMFMAHLDVTPDVRRGNVTPAEHLNYDGSDIRLRSGVILSPNTPQGSHLKDCIGKDVITGDGTFALGADDKSGCTIMLGLINEMLNGHKTPHGDLYFVFSQNEDIGRAADRFETKYLGGEPGIVIDIDGDQCDKFSVENFTATMRSYRFCGNNAYPGEGLANKYADALTAASYFIGKIPPKYHPSSSHGKQGYLHCYSMDHPIDADGKAISTDYVIKIKLRYFDKSEGQVMRCILDTAASETSKAFPFVEIRPIPEVVQYENIAYSMYPGMSDVILKSTVQAGANMSPYSERCGTTSAMMAAKGLHGGPCLYSGQQAEHSVLEWVCVEDMLKMVEITKNIIKNVVLEH